MQELVVLNKSKETITENYFHITFDDGLKEFYTIVAPILKERNVHATVFLNSDFIDNEELFFRFKASILFDEIKGKNILSILYNNKEELDKLALENKIDFSAYLKQHQPYLTSEQIKELIKDGFTFGAHSKNHPLYKKLSFEEQVNQTKESVEIITNQFNLSYKVFSFPFTDDGVSKAVFDKINKFTDLTFGCAGIKDDSAQNHLQRIPMEGLHLGGVEKSGKEIIKAEYLYYILKKKVGKHKIIR